MSEKHYHYHEFSRKKRKPRNTREALEEPLIVVNNPLKRILQWIYDIRTRQTTKFSINLNIPLLPFLLAIAVAIGVVFVFLFGAGVKIGQITITRELLLAPSPTAIVVKEPTATLAPIETSKIGTIKSTYQYKVVTPTPTKEAVPTDASDSAVKKVSPTLKPTKAPLRYLLLLSNGDYVFLKTGTVSLQSYIDRRVLVTGMYNSATNTLTIRKTSDIELLP